MREWKPWYRKKKLMVQVLFFNIVNYQLTCSLFSLTPKVNILKAASAPPRSSGLTNIGGDLDSIVNIGFALRWISIPGIISNSYVYLLMRKYL